MLSSSKAKFLWDQFVWSGIYRSLEDAIKSNDKSQLDIYEELVNHYNATIIMSGKHLTDKLEELKNI